MWLAAIDLGFVISRELGRVALGLRDNARDPQGMGEGEALKAWVMTRKIG